MEITQCPPARGKSDHAFRRDEWKRRQERQEAKKEAKKRAKQRDRANFYQSRSWLVLRYQILKKYGPKCMLCGATKETGAVIHVDHIKPRKKYPELELKESNLQVLCASCNAGKWHIDETDWR